MKKRSHKLIAAIIAIVMLLTTFGSMAGGVADNASNSGAASVTPVDNLPQSTDNLSQTEFDELMSSEFDDDDEVTIIVRLSADGLARLGLLQKSEAGGNIPTKTGNDKKTKCCRSKKPRRVKSAKQSV